jgi:hypothetical protein
MVNDARTLLMNYTGPHQEDINTPGDVYIPTYTPPTLSDGLQSVRTILFGADPDYDGLLYRVGQYMALLHSTDYREYLFSRDSRITYDPLASDIFEDTVYGATVQSTSSQTLSVGGTFTVSPVNGRVNTLWTVRGLSGNRVEVTNVTDNLLQTQQAYVGVELVLPGSDLTFSITGSSITEGDYWQVLYKVRPQPDLGVVLSTLGNLTVTMRRALFGNEETGLEEPYQTFANLLDRHYALAFQMSGVLLALIERTSEAVDAA